jgi:transcriptional antiterminator RfaH
MSVEQSFETLSWYVIHTHPKQEDRAESNLKAWNTETFSPRIKEEHYDEWARRPTYRIKPLFPRYIFARFKASEMYRKVRFTRGVHSIVSFGSNPTPVNDEVISIIQTRTGADGLVRISEDLKAGDEVIIQEGPLRGIIGVFEKEMKEADRVRILLREVNFQAHVLVARCEVKKVMSAAPRF